MVQSVVFLLQNARPWRVDRSQVRGMDPFSSAWWFDGWNEASWRIGIPPPEVRTVAAETWMLSVGWKRSPYGLLSITESPPAGR